MNKFQYKTAVIAAALFLYSLAAGQEEPGDTFTDTLPSGARGPEMVVIPAGSFSMGCVSGLDCFDDEKPLHQVTFSQPFAVSRHEITFKDYDLFTAPDKVDDEGWGRGRRPVINVSWNDAREYVSWLSSQTGQSYRLLSEAEWEYAARAGSTTRYSWGNFIGAKRANCILNECGDDFENTSPAGSFAPNAFGLYDMHGNVWEWTEDCWSANYSDASADGSARRTGNCERHVIRGGSWVDSPWLLRSAYRHSGSAGGHYDFKVGFRVARALAQ